MKAVDICIASLYRNGHCIKTVESLVVQPEINNIYLVCNNYTTEQFEYVASQLKKYENVILFNRQNQKGCSEKFYPIHLSDSKYIGFADDDLIYPIDYLQKLIAGCEKYQCLVSLHGRILKPRPITQYYRDKIAVYGCLHDVAQDTGVDIAGSGVCLVERSKLPLLSVLYNQIIHPNMSDIYLSALCLQSGVKRVVLSHAKGYIQHKTIEENDNYIFNSHRNNCQPQTDFVNEYFL